MSAMSSVQAYVLSTSNIWWYIYIHINYMNYLFDLHWSVAYISVPLFQKNNQRFQGFVAPVLVFPRNRQAPIRQIARNAGEDPSEVGKSQGGEPGELSQGSLNFPFWGDQTIHIYGHFDGFAPLTVCLGWCAMLAPGKWVESSIHLFKCSEPGVFKASWNPLGVLPVFWQGPSHRCFLLFFCAYHRRCGFVLEHFHGWKKPLGK